MEPCPYMYYNINSSKAIGEVIVYNTIASQITIEWNISFAFVSLLEG